MTLASVSGDVGYLNTNLETVGVCDFHQGHAQIAAVARGDLYPEHGSGKRCDNRRFREIELRLAEQGLCFRYSGALRCKTVGKVRQLACVAQRAKSWSGSREPGPYRGA